VGAAGWSPRKEIYIWLVFRELGLEGGKRGVLIFYTRIGADGGESGEWTGGIAGVRGRWNRQEEDGVKRDNSGIEDFWSGYRGYEEEDEEDAGGEAVVDIAEVDEELGAEPNDLDARYELVEGLIEQIGGQLATGSGKASVADLIRLMQLEKELKPRQCGRMVIEWVDKLQKKKR
jgi:hypothetical protein